MRCTLCDHHVGPVGYQCEKCQRKVCDYFCKHCHLISDNDRCFHCDQCGICWNGKTFSKTDTNLNYHCEKCQICVSSKTHICQPENENGKCCICHESWKHGFKLAVIHGQMCGHFMHHQCFDSLKTMNPLREDGSNFFEKCPCCEKSMILNIHDDLDLYFKEMFQNLIAKELISLEVANNIQVDIHCNDCLQSSEKVPFRLFYHQCPHCRSCNTKISKYHGEIPEDLLELSSLV